MVKTFGHAYAASRCARQHPQRRRRRLHRSLHRRTARGGGLQYRRRQGELRVGPGGIQDRRSHIRQADAVGIRQSAAQRGPHLLFSKPDENESPLSRMGHHEIGLQASKARAISSTRSASCARRPSFVDLGHGALHGTNGSSPMSCCDHGELTYQRC
jgi:hypothetical protein